MSAHSSTWTQLTDTDKLTALDFTSITALLIRICNPSLLRQPSVIFIYCRWETSTTCRMDHDAMMICFLKFEFLRPWGMAIGTSFVIWMVKPLSICVHGCWRFSWSLWWSSYMWSIHLQQVCNDVLILYTCWFSHYLRFDKQYDLLGAVNYSGNLYIRWIL